MSTQAPLRRSAMPQSTTLYVGLEGHKEWSVLLHHTVTPYQDIHTQSTFTKKSGLGALIGL
jgi:hypothetical protein